MTDLRTRQRRMLLTVISVVLLIGVVGVTIALVAAPGDEGNEPRVTVPGSGDPFGDLAQCRADRVARFTVAGAPNQLALTANAAAEPWVGSKESTQTTSTGDDSKLVVIGLPGKPPRSVLSLRKETGSWQVVTTSVCLDAQPAGTTCTPDTLVVGKVTYRRADVPTTVEVGAADGRGTLEHCEEADGRTFASRGAVGPVTTYVAQGNAGSKALVVTQDGGSPTLFRAE